MGKSLALMALHAHVKEYTIEGLRELMIKANLTIEREIFKDWRERRWLRFYLKEGNTLRVAWSRIRLGILKIFPSLASCLVIIGKKAI